MYTCMVNEPSKAAFTFETFKISKFSFVESSSNSKEIGLHLLPRGIYWQENGNFDVIMHFKATDVEDNMEESESVIVEAILTARFCFEDVPHFENIPKYFYLNSLAIAFPYLRAFISSLTIQANIFPLILPVLNLSGMEKQLIEATEVRSEAE